jgi:hypothetical protein
VTRIVYTLSTALAHILYALADYADRTPLLGRCWDWVLDPAGGWAIRTDSERERR